MSQSLGSPSLPKLAFNQQTLGFLISLLVHAAIGVVLLWWWHEQPRTRPTSALKLFDLTAQSPAAGTPPAQSGEILSPLPPRPEVELRVRQNELALREAGNGEGAGCAIAADVQAALLADQAAMVELAAVPSTAVSVAGALVLWSGHPEEARLTLPAVRAVMLTRLEATSDECLDLVLTGPDLLFITSGGRTFALAVGSGSWRWRNYLEAMKDNMHPNNAE